MRGERILGIRLEPVFVVSDEGLKVLGVEYGTALFLEQHLQVFGLHTFHSLIVAIGQGIQLPTTTQELGHLRLGAQCAGSLEVDIVWMQGKHADDIVGIGVVPTTIRRGIVDRQYLDELHTCSYGPIYHAAQIAKIAHAIRVFTTQRKDRNGHTGSTPRLFSQTQMTTIEYQHLAVGNLVCGCWLLAISRWL